MFEGHRVCFLDRWITPPPLSRSSRLLTVSVAGTPGWSAWAAPFSLPAVPPPPNYCTTASASPATTNIQYPLLLLFLPTVQSSVLVGQRRSWINTESKGGIFICLILSYRYIFNGVCLYGVLIYRIGTLPSVNCTPTPPSIVWCHHICIISPIAQSFFFFLNTCNRTGSIPEKSL